MIVDSRKHSPLEQNNSTSSYMSNESAQGNSRFVLLENVAAEVPVNEVGNKGKYVVVESWNKHHLSDNYVVVVIMEKGHSSKPILNNSGGVKVHGAKKNHKGLPRKFLQIKKKSDSKISSQLLLSEWV
ncbi:hypothetical protein V6N13_046974 [Hibiscus sabdariffa]|uniref:Uncharacterized protein n=1 Tax=Hibiscus sabdariffa TaxID=183260 RepID=A0ABR2CC24_9ROSI